MTSTSFSSAVEGDQCLRVVITNTSRSWGGTEHYAAQVAAGLVRRGHDVRFLWADPVVGERLRELGVPEERCRLRNDADLRALQSLYVTFRKQECDVVLLTKWREYWLGGLAAKLARVPMTVIRLGLRILPKDDLKRRLIFRLADRIVVNAEEIRDGLLSRPWMDPAKIRVVHNGVDLHRFRPGGDGMAFRLEIGIPPSVPLVGTIGAMSPQKDHDLFARTAARLHEDFPDAHFTVVGEGFLRSPLEARIRELDLKQRFHLPGFRRDVRPALAAFDLFVLSSYNEGMARVLLEALACGLPVVATDVSGTRACVQDGVNGLVVPPRNREALAAAIGRLLRDSGMRQEMGERSRRIAEERFDAERMLSETMQLLRGGRSRFESSAQRR